MIRGALRTATYLRKNIVHGLAGSCITFAQETHEAEDLDLQERVGDAGYIVLRAVARCDERLEMADE